MLRAFGLFFHLANIAEQHHRLRRLRAYEHEGRVARESLARRPGPARRRGRDATTSSAKRLPRLSVELVFTAHPTEATRRGVLRAHRRIAALLRELDDPELPPSAGARAKRDLAEEVTLLWQTDEVRSQRPRVVDEIRHGLWFVEESLWSAAPRLLAELRELPARRPARTRSPLRFGTWIGGDLDGNPHAGAETVEAALEQARALALALLARDVRELARAWGISSELVAVDPAVGAVADVPPESNADEPYRRRLTSIWQRLRADELRLGRRAARRARPARPQPACASAARGSRTVGSPRSAAASRSSACTSRSSTCGRTPAPCASATRGSWRRSAPPAGCSSGTERPRSTG